MRVFNKVEDTKEFKPKERRLEEGWYNLVCRSVTPSVREKDGAKFYKFKFEVLDGLFKGRFVWASYYPYLSRHQVYLNNLLKSFGFSKQEVGKVMENEDYFNICIGLNVRGELFHNERFDNLELFTAPKLSYKNEEDLLDSYLNRDKLAKAVSQNINEGDVLY